MALKMENKKSLNIAQEKGPQRAHRLEGKVENRGIKPKRKKKRAYLIIPF